MFKTENLGILIMIIGVLIIQKFLIPRLKFRLLIYIIPIISFLTGTIFTYLSQNDMLTKALMLGGSIVLSMILILMGETAVNEHRKNIQEKYSKNEFYKKR